jgi:hypothetical protein
LRVDPTTGEVLEPRRMPRFRPDPDEIPTDDPVALHLLRAVLIARFATIGAIGAGLLVAAIAGAILNPFAALAGVAVFAVLKLQRRR